MPNLETEEEAAERIVDFNEQRKENKTSKIKKEIVSDNKDDEDDEDDEDYEDDMIKKAELLLKNVEKDTLNRITAGDSYISENKIIKFLKRIIISKINNRNQIK